MDKYKKFQKVDKNSYESINDFLKKRSLLTTREWMVSEILCDFRQEGSGSVPMTEVGKNLPELFPFMEKKYSASEVSNAKNSLEKKVCRAGTTFFYGIKKGCFKKEKIKELITDIATGLEEIREILDEKGEEEFLKELPDELRSFLKEMKDIQEGQKVELDSPLFGEFISGELGEKWVEEIVSDEFGKVKVEFSFDRVISYNDLLAPEEIIGKEKYLDLNMGYGYWDNGSYIDRFEISFLD